MVYGVGKAKARQVRNKRNKGQRPGSGNQRVNQVNDEQAPFNPYVKAAILEVVENQIRDNDPPETRQTLERLLSREYSRRQAREMVGSAVVEEIWSVMHDHKPFDRARFIALLEQLG